MPPRITTIRQPHRDHYEIIKQILQTVHTRTGGYKSFELPFRCELTWPQFLRYRDMLVRNKLLIPSHTGRTELYEIPDKGMRFLKVLAEIEDNLRPATD